MLRKRLRTISTSHFNFKHNTPDSLTIQSKKSIVLLPLSISEENTTKDVMKKHPADQGLVDNKTYNALRILLALSIYRLFSKTNRRYRILIQIDENE